MSVPGAGGTFDLRMLGDHRVCPVLEIGPWVNIILHPHERRKTEHILLEVVPIIVRTCDSLELIYVALVLVLHYLDDDVVLPVAEEDELHVAGGAYVLEIDELLE